MVTQIIIIVFQMVSKMCVSSLIKNCKASIRTVLQTNWIKWVEIGWKKCWLVTSDTETKYTDFYRGLGSFVLV